MSTKSKVVVAAFIVVAVIVMAVVAVGNVLGWFGWDSWSVQKVVQTAVGPQAAIDKYHWFVDQSNAIKQSDAQIVVFQQRLKDIDANYASLYGVDKTSWPASAKLLYQHDWGIAHDDLVAMVSMRNSVVRDYNAASAKWDWRIFNGNTHDFPNLPPQTYDEMPTP